MSDNNENTPRPITSLVSSLDDARKKAENEHTQHLLDMFAKDPGLLRDAIIISPSIDSVLYPPGMSDHEVVGALEAAKLTVLLGEEDDEEDDEEGK